MASPETIGWLVRTASVLEQTSGTIMFEGELPPRVGIVLRGTVVATWSSPDGRIVYSGLYGPGQFIGLTTLRGGSIASGVDALTKVTIVAWPSQEFRAITDADPALTLDLLDHSIYTIQLLNRLIKLRTFTTAESRLAGLLLQYETFCFSRDTPLLARGRLSALAGVTPQMVSRIFRKWEAAAIVRRIGASGLELIDRTALEAEAAPFVDFPAPDPPIRGAPRT